MRFETYINEGKITRKDKKNLSQVIMNPENGTFELEDGTEIKVEKTRSGTQLIFEKGNDDLIFQLTQLCDSLGYEFDYQEERNEMVFTIKD